MTSRLFKLWEKERIARAHRDLNEDERAEAKRLKDEAFAAEATRVQRRRDRAFHAAEGGAAGMLNQASAEGDEYPFAPAGFTPGDRLCAVTDCTIPPSDDDTCEAHR